jgi:anthranilate phosphoribosyltransferase
MEFLHCLHRVVEWKTLAPDEAETVMQAILNGGVPAPLLASFLTAIRMRGEDPLELAGFARAMRAASTKVPAAGPLLDTCGTGGDASGTFNISTTVAFVVAGAGVPVAKHGNRAASSKCGSADILEAMGVNIALTAAQMAECLARAGIAFLFAPTLHPAMKNVGPLRRELGFRTLFNLLGPLTNPAGAQSQLIGAPSFKAAETMALALASLGTGHSYVVYGADGLDEISIAGLSVAYEVKGSSVRKTAAKPEDFGLPTASLDDLRGSGVDENLAILRQVLGGVRGPRRDVVVANAAMALIAAGKAEDRLEGARIAAKSIDSGAALESASKLVEVSRTL